MDGVKGYYRAGKVNKRGEALVSFCARNETTIMNTCFEKNIPKYTWQHLGSKKWHCVDYWYVMTRRRQRRLCCDEPVLNAGPSISCSVHNFNFSYHVRQQREGLELCTQEKAEVKEKKIVLLLLLTDDALEEAGHCQTTRPHGGMYSLSRPVICHIGSVYH